MQRLTFDDLTERADEFDDLVAQTPDSDHFCSSTPWILSAHEAFSSGFDTWIAESDHGMVALVENWHNRLGHFRQPLEASWCLANPFASPDPRALAHDFADACRDEEEWDLLFLSGIQRDSDLYHGLIEAFGRAFFVGVGPSVSRYIASLDGGIEEYLMRRSSKFRANLRRARRRADEAGISYEYYGDVSSDEQWRDLYDRILSVEQRSWKGKAGTGIVDDPMRDFYRRMLPRLAVRGDLRVLFVKMGDEDIAFVFGGIFEDTYRGLQLSYDDAYKSHGAGNLAQLAIIEELCDEGIAHYDLGSELEYKSNWAESRFETLSVIIRRW